MNLAMKLSIAVAAALATTGLVALPASAQTDTQSTESTSATPDLTADGALVFTQSGNIVDFYTALGITQSDIPVVSSAEASVLDDVIDLVSADSPTTAASTTLSSSSTSCSDTGALVSYAQQIAEANSAIDPDATTPDQETVYMYMSHFFDLPSICSDNTGYYPDWITDDDRLVYNSYLSATNNTNLVTSIGSSILSANTIASSPESAVMRAFKDGLGNKIAGGTNGLDAGLAGKSLKESLNTVAALLINGGTAEEIVDQMRSNLSSTWTMWDTLSAIIGFSAALMEPGVGPMMFGIGLTAMGMQLTGINTLYQKAAFNAMRLSTSGRVSSRLMRMYGM